MNGQLDKLALGMHGKLTFLADLALVALALLWSVEWDGAFIASTATALTLSALAAWGLATSLLRLYSPHTPRSQLDSIALAVIGGALVAVTLYGVDRLVLSAPPSHFDVARFASFLAIGVVGTQLFLFRSLTMHAKPTEGA